MDFSDLVDLELDGRPNFLMAKSLDNRDGTFQLDIPGRPEPFQTDSMDEGVFTEDQVVGFQFEAHEEAFTFTEAVWAAQ